MTPGGPKWTPPRSRKGASTAAVGGGPRRKTPQTHGEISPGSATAVTVWRVSSSRPITQRVRPAASIRKPYPLAEHQDKVRDVTADAVLAEAEAAIKAGNQARACALVHRHGQLGGSARPAFDLLLRYAISEDGALHAEKYYRTASEEFAATRPAFRWRHLAALARVTASEYGHPRPASPMHAGCSACRLLVCKSRRRGPTRNVRADESLDSFTCRTPSCSVVPARAVYLLRLPAVPACSSGTVSPAGPAGRGKKTRRICRKRPCLTPGGRGWADENRAKFSHF